MWFLPDLDPAWRAIAVLSAAMPMGADAQQLADALGIEGDEGVLADDPALLVAAEEAAGVVARQAVGGLGQVVGAEAEELGGLGDLAGAKSVAQVPTPQRFLWS